MGGGISSAIARALGAGRRDDADALVLHALIINIALGVVLLGHHAGVRAADLSRARRRGRRARRGAAPIRTSCSPATCCCGCMNGFASVDPRHRQHAGAGIGDLRRRGRAGTAVAGADLRHRPVSGARHRRRRRGAAAVLRGAAPPCSPGTSCPDATSRDCGSSRLRWPLFRDILRRRRRRGRHLGADQRDHRARDRVGRCRAAAPQRPRAMAPARGWNIC